MLFNHIVGVDACFNSIYYKHAQNIPVPISIRTVVQICCLEVIDCHIAAKFKKQDIIRNLLLVFCNGTYFTGLPRIEKYSSSVTTFTSLMFVWLLLYLLMQICLSVA